MAQAVRADELYLPARNVRPSRTYPARPPTLRKQQKWVVAARAMNEIEWFPTPVAFSRDASMTARGPQDSQWYPAVFSGAGVDALSLEITGFVDVTMEESWVA